MWMFDGQRDLFRAPTTYWGLVVRLVTHLIATAVVFTVFLFFDMGNRCHIFLVEFFAPFPREGLRVYRTARVRCGLTRCSALCHSPLGRIFDFHKRIWRAPMTSL